MQASLVLQDAGKCSLLGNGKRNNHAYSNCWLFPLVRSLAFAEQLQNTVVTDVWRIVIINLGVMQTTPARKVAGNNS